MRLPGSSVLCTVGTACTMSAVGSTETHRALVTNSPFAVAFAAVDAGLVEVDTERSTAAEPLFVRVEAGRAGESISVQEIDAAYGERLRADMGIRSLPRERLSPHVITDVAAPLPHDLERGG